VLSEAGETQPSCQARKEPKKGYTSMIILQGNRLGMLLGIIGFILGGLIFQYLPGPYNLHTALTFFVPGLFWAVLDRRIRRKTGDYKTEHGGAWLGMPLCQYGVAMCGIGLFFGIICPRESNAELRAYWSQISALNARGAQPDQTGLMKRVEERAKAQGQAAGETLLADEMTQALHIAQARMVDCQRIHAPATYTALHQEQIAFYQKDALCLDRVIQMLRAHDVSGINSAFEALQTHTKEGEALQQRLVQEAEKISTDN